LDERIGDTLVPSHDRGCV